MVIDTKFDVRTDGGKDPDTYSPTLCRYHRLLWSKPLPGGVRFELGAPTTPAPYYLRSEVGKFWLSSDSVIATFIHYDAMKPIVGQMSDAENEAFMAIAYTIGGFLLWPAERVHGKQTINMARGLLGNIADRLDLTLECIRRHYRGEESPLGKVLARYSDFFALFEDFRGYVDFWLLQDLVDDNNSAVRYFMPFDDFKPPAKPQDVDAYREYRRLSIEFVQARNRRIDNLELTSPVDAASTGVTRPN
jgi:hypothetical protein